MNQPISKRRPQLLAAWLIFAAIGSYLPANASAAPDSSSMEEDFRNPPATARPYVWWHWLGSNFSKEGITKDLEAMKASGVGGATIFNISSSVMQSHAPTLNNPWPDQTYRSPKYWEALRHAASEAKRLGLEIGLHNTVGYSTTGGPWIDEERSMQRIVWSETSVEGGQAVRVNLPAPVFTADEGWGKTGRTISWFRDIAVLAVPAEKPVIQLNEVIELTAKMTAEGALEWAAPAGRWTVYRMAHASTGRPPHPVPDDVLGKVLEADKMSLEQTQYHWQTVIRPIQEKLGPLVGASFRHFLIDSFEAGRQNWTPKFREEFKNRKGYDPVPWLTTFNATVRNDTKGPPVRTIGSADLSVRFELDYREVIFALFYENGWKPAVEMMHAAGIALQHEAYGGQFDTVAASALADLPMDEFWTGRPTKIKPQVIGAARAAGRTVIGAEAFTGSPGQSKWTETPAFLKRTADESFAAGVNRMVLHQWVHQPFDDRYKPGLGMGWWGTHFNRHQTWFEPGKDFFLYICRVQALLQLGETPVDYVNVVQPDATGDVITMEVFLKHTQVKDGRVLLPSGRSYRFIHVPNKGALLPEAVARIGQLLTEGATVVSSKPKRSPSLAGYPQCDERVAALAETLWGAGGQAKRAFGRGTLFTTGDVAEAKRALALPEAVLITAPKVADIRTLQRAQGDATWFFAANVGNPAQTFTLSFAVMGKQPELWDAETGVIRDAPLWRVANGRTEVDLTLDGAKSVFVVFRKAAGLDPVIGVEAPAGWSLATAKRGMQRVEAAVPLAGTLRFASGKTKAFVLTPGASVPVVGTWNVKFKPAVGSAFSEALTSLVDFSRHENPEIKYFSGTATYTIQVNLPAEALKAGHRFDLDLGGVYDMATVSVNGVPQGVWWNPPFNRDVTDALKPGSNTLEIAITNTWHNRLVGDEQFPADFEWGVSSGERGRMMKGYPEWFLKSQPRPEKGRRAFVTWYYHRNDTPLLPAGLLGPVTLVAKASVALVP
jgi:hypothetical protein